MRILFTYNRTWLSGVIRKVTKEPVSHCAIEAVGFVIHSNFWGVNAVKVEKFKETNEVYAGVEVAADYERLLRLFCHRNTALYDFGALLYLGARLICPWLPKKNLWQCSGMDLCTEWTTNYLNGEADSMITPYKLYLTIQPKAA